MLENLSFSKFKAYFRVLEPVRLPPFTGSAFRGVLGNGLRRVRFGMKQGCTDCPIRSQCRYGNLYTYLFESPWDHPFIEPGHSELNPRLQRETYPQPITIDPPAGGDFGPGDTIALPFTLVGKGISFFPFVACALSIMGSLGIGQGKGRLLLEGVTDGFASDDNGSSLVYDAGEDKIVGPAQIFDFDMVRQWASDVMNDAPIPPEQIKIRFLTPFRYKSDGNLGSPLTFDIFIRSVFRRLTLLSVHSPVSSNPDYKSLLSQAASVRAVDSGKMKWRQVERYSARQDRRMNMDGFTGEIAFSGDLGVFLPYIKMGEFLHVGKATSFGHGKYEIIF